MRVRAEAIAAGAKADKVGSTEGGVCGQGTLLCCGMFEQRKFESPETIYSLPSGARRFLCDVTPQRKKKENSRKWHGNRVREGRAHPRSFDVCVRMIIMCAYLLFTFILSFASYRRALARRCVVLCATL